MKVIIEASDGTVKEEEAAGHNPGGL